MPRRCTRALALVTTALSVLACSGDEVLGTDPGAVPLPVVPLSSGGGSQQPQLTGIWSHTRYVTDASGAVHASETRWEFTDDGQVERTVVATNITYGYTDSQTRVGSWVVQGSEIVVTYAAPSTGTVRMQWRLSTLDGEPVLYLNDTPFVRLG